jgi:Spy/CpxP family protein refolding chaperone
MEERRMGSRLALIGAAALLCSAAAFAQPSESAAEKPAPPCEGEIFVFQAGPPGHVAKVTLCSKKDATPDDLGKMFESAASTLSLNTRMAPEKRDKLVAQMRAKAAEVGRGKAAATSLAAAPPTAGLAPLPPSAPVDHAPEYSALPPMPPPNPAVATSASVSASLPALTRPRLTIECFNPAELAGAAPCDSLERETVLRVRADETLPAGTSLRFLRRGDLRAEIELAQLARGKSTQFALPQPVCTGVAESKVEIQIVRHAKASDAGQVVDSMGPYFLRC